jgi:hypothetical protein
MLCLNVALGQLILVLVHVHVLILGRIKIKINMIDCILLDMSIRRVGGCGVGGVAEV